MTYSIILEHLHDWRLITPSSIPGLFQSYGRFWSKNRTYVHLSNHLVNRFNSKCPVQLRLPLPIFIIKLCETWDTGWCDTSDGNLGVFPFSARFIVATLSLKPEITWEGQSPKILSGGIHYWKSLGCWTITCHNDDGYDNVISNIYSTPI